MTIYRDILKMQAKKKAQEQDDAQKKAGIQLERIDVREPDDRLSREPDARRKNTVKVDPMKLDADPQADTGWGKIKKMLSGNDADMLPIDSPAMADEEKAKRKKKMMKYRDEEQ